MHPAQQQHEIRLFKTYRFEQPLVILRAHLFLATPLHHVHARNSGRACSFDRIRACIVAHQCHDLYWKAAVVRSIGNGLKVAPVARSHHHGARRWREQRGSTELFRDDCAHRAGVISEESFAAHRGNQGASVPALAQRSQRLAQNKDSQAGLALFFNDAKRTEESDVPFACESVEPAKV